MDRRCRSRREELAQLRDDLRAKGATFRHIAGLISAQYKVNSRVAFRLAHGLTQQQVADAYNAQSPSAVDRPVTHKQISYWEAWPEPTGRPPSIEVLNRLARIYRCGAADLLDGEDHSGLDTATSASMKLGLPVAAGVRETRAEPTDVLARVDTFIAGSGDLLVRRESDYQQLVNALIEWACRMKRRDILQWLSWAAASAAAAPVLEGLDADERERVALAFSTPRRVDADVIAHIESVLWRCMRQDDALGPQAALDTTLGQRSLVRGLLSEAPEALKPRLLSLYANLSRFAGWLSFDLDNYPAATDYYETARTAAHEAHDTALGAFVLCNMSHLATWRGQPRIGIDHAVAAQGWAARTDDARLQAYAEDVAARAFAMDQQASHAVTALDRARAALARAGQPEAGDHTYFYNSGQLASTESTCYLRLGQAERGAVTAEHAMSEIDRSFVRNLALNSLRLGMCRLRAKAPDVDRAVSAFQDAAQLAGRNRSIRLVHRLQRGWRELEPWQNVKSVKGTRDQLAAYSVAF